MVFLQHTTYLTSREQVDKSSSISIQLLLQWLISMIQCMPDPRSINNNWSHCFWYLFFSGTLGKSLSICFSWIRIKKLSGSDISCKIPYRTAHIKSGKKLSYRFMSFFLTGYELWDRLYYQLLIPNHYNHLLIQKFRVSYTIWTDSPKFCFDQQLLCIMIAY